ncbi:hypothetical protein OsccyDRAFT_4017 [Leptolyngbyaceae cyanobacterium JSC-12]|nr:hypothetical protein OsccyDRAFT_4017 [Leptolyngbyaceae cyanobacterium JSC-12]
MLAVTEIELSGLHQQELEQCIGEPLTLAKKLATWQQRNAKQADVV